MNSERDIDKLMDEYGVVGAIRYMEQFDGGGSGDYTKEKQERSDLTYEERLEFHNRILNRQVLQEETNYGEDVPCVRETVAYTEKGLKYKTESRVDFEGMVKYMNERNIGFQDMTEDEMKMFVKDWKD